MTSDEKTPLTGLDVCVHGEESSVLCESETCTTEVQETEHKRRQYRLPSQLNQTASVFSVQMRLFFKSRLIYVFLILALLIPIFAFDGTVAKLIYGRNNTIASLLIVLPIMMAIIIPMLSGRILSSEFRNKTAYMMFPLPVSRTAFYFGKFLASFVLSLGIFSLAYGLAILSGINTSIDAFPSDFLGSYLITVAGVFAITATAYGLGTVFARGAIPITVAITLGLPFLIMAIMLLYPADIPTDIQNYIKLLPQFDGYQALLTMDAGFIFMDPLIDTYLMSDLSPKLYIGAAVAWGALFLAMGLLKIIKKEL